MSLPRTADIGPKQGLACVWSVRWTLRVFTDCKRIGLMVVEAPLGGIAAKMGKVCARGFGKRSCANGESVRFRVVGEAERLSACVQFYEAYVRGFDVRPDEKDNGCRVMVARRA